MPRFGRPGTYAVDGSPIGVRAGAIDSSSALDLVTANEAGQEGPSLSFLFNRGAGSFLPEQRMGLSAGNYILQAVATGDFNADDRDDVAVAVDDISVFPVAMVLVYLNDGDGFAAPVPYTLGGLFPQCIEAADVTGDGALDLLVCHARSVGGSSEGLITVLGGQRTGDTPNGAFVEIFSDRVGTAPAHVSAGDADSDGRADLLVVDPDAERVFILYGTPVLRRFERAVELPAVANPVAVLTNDVPGQALPQVLVLAGAGQALLFTYRQTTPRTFSAPLEQSVALIPMAMGLANLDADGIDDLIVVSALGADLWYGEAAGTFRFGESLVDDDTFEAFTLADLNGDGRTDFAASASDEDRVTVVLNGADVPFTPGPTATITATPIHTATPTPTPTGGGACAGDCNLDGLVIVNELIQGVNIALGNAAVGTCAAFDLDGNGRVEVNELIAGVNNAQSGCAGSAI